MIAFLHTSDIHIPKFEKLVRKYNNDVEIKHFVNSDLLTSALQTGKTDTDSFMLEVKKIKKLKPNLIICTCSTYGAACDTNESIHRIDLPIAAYLVGEYDTIGLAFTATSTQLVSEKLLLKQADNIGEKIAITPIDCSSAWQYYESDDFENYARSIAATIVKYQDKVDVVFLAQASMGGAIDYLKDFSKKVFTSPEHGVQEYLKQIQNK
ncbi:hypothetical protein [Flavicella sp.]|uniref:hypothetical protein n=1 Tax=Flavicella sp. TaxID=2957742 RepID=UPI00263112ED|nr:hypothetical protein [Flavicella sp.]MDG1803649.1 hypothetical protein [Flavicella sp.]MDG2279890.1 hypothetical protein [Flavicella sp.]